MARQAAAGSFVLQLPVSIEIMAHDEEKEESAEMWQECCTIAW